MTDRTFPTISLCVIARDEEEMLGACLDSARAFVDEMIVLDTGSADRTREVAREHGARVESFTWCDDFAAARNAAIEYASGDWVFMLDADERIEDGCGPELKVVAAAADAAVHVVMPSIKSILNPDAADGFVISFHGRMLRRSPAIRYIGAIHEDPKFLPEPKRTVAARAPQIRLWHGGYVLDRYNARNKDQRNSRLLEAEMQRRPDSATLHMYVGMQHAANGRHAECGNAMQRALELMQPGEEAFRGDVYTLLISSQLHANDVGGVQRAARQGEADDALTPKAREMLAEFYEKLGLYGEAERHLLNALASNGQVVALGFPGSGTWNTHALLARVYDRMGSPRLALDHLERALAHEDALHRGDLARSAARVAGKARNLPAARRWLEEAERLASNTLESHLVLLSTRLSLLAGAIAGGSLDDLSPLEAAVVTGDWQAAYDAALRLPVEGPASLAKVVLVASRLVDQQAPEAAIDLLSRVIDMAQTEPRAYWLLLRAFTAVNRPDDALAALEILKQLPNGEATPAAV